MQAPQYHETLFSRLYPGNQHSNPTYIPVFKALDTFLPLTPEQKRKTLLRADAGFGSDDNVDFALDEGWQVLTKGSGGRRPGAWAKQIAPAAWQQVAAHRWLAPSPNPLTYLRPVQQWVLRWQTPAGQLKHATLLCSVLDWSASALLTAYDARGACEAEFRTDKQGLKLARRRKLRLPAQEALILLTDLAHNTLAWLAPYMFPDGPLTTFGPLRLIEDVFSIPGRLRFDNQRLVEVQLNKAHPYALEVAAGLTNLLDHFGWP